MIEIRQKSHTRPKNVTVRNSDRGSPCLPGAVPLSSDLPSEAEMDGCDDDDVYITRVDLDIRQYIYMYHPVDAECQQRCQTNGVTPGSYNQRI
jgi:hypothetical protein